MTVVVRYTVPYFLDPTCTTTTYYLYILPLLSPTICARLRTRVRETEKNLQKKITKNIRRMGVGDIQPITPVEKPATGGRDRLKTDWQGCKLRANQCSNP